MSLTSEARQDVQRLLQAGEKIRAVKYLHETFSISLVDAKTLVEAVARETEGAYTTRKTPFTEVTSLDSNLRSRVLDLLARNEKIEAIKIVKTELNTGLKEAMVIVEAVQKGVEPDFKSIHKVSVGSGSPVNLFIVIFGCVGLLLFGIAGTVYYFQAKTINNSERVEGRVIDMKYSGKGAAPVISYRFHGKHLTWQSGNYSSPPAYELNEAVELFVNKDDPDDVIANTLIDRWLLIIILGGLGLLFSLFAIGFAFADRKI